MYICHGKHLRTAFWIGCYINVLLLLLLIIYLTDLEWEGGSGIFFGGLHFLRGSVYNDIIVALFLYIISHRLKFQGSDVRHYEMGLCRVPV